MGNRPNGLSNLESLISSSSQEQQLSGQVLATFVEKFSPQTVSPELGYPISTHRAKESSVGISVMAKITFEVPKVLKKPSLIEVAPVAEDIPNELATCGTRFDCRVLALLWLLHSIQVSLLGHHLESRDLSLIVLW